MIYDLTSGSVGKNIVRFSIPYFLSYLLQTLYGLADLFIIGQFDGTGATTAVSIGSQVMHMLTVVIVGLAMGTTVSLSQAVGAKKKEDAAKAVGNTVVLFLALSAVLTALLLLLVRPIASVMQTPDAAVYGTRAYLRICFAGIPFITAYNIISSIFRGLGDSKTPMYFVAIACAVNIALDYLFIGGFDMGPSGAAYGTILAQAVSVGVSLLVIQRRGLGFRVTREAFRPARMVMKKLIRIGLPVAAQDGMIQISFLVITMIANLRGLDDAAAVGITEKLISMIFLVPSSMLSSISTIASQNLGAGKTDRARKTLRYALIIAGGYGISMALLMQFTGGFFLGLFSKDPRVVSLGWEYLRSYSVDTFFAGIHFCFSGYFVAAEHSIYSFVHNITSAVFVRIPASYFLSKMFPTTLLPMGFAAPMGSIVSDGICIVLYVHLRKKSDSVSKVAG
ncbi:MAG: MATE family efflux transporter [Eubacteriales bacterium]|nr:MATE family efflux transporter [Eubacteriales bacterium]